MARPKNIVSTVNLDINLTKRLEEKLDDLTKSGFFGKNPADTASILIREFFLDLLSKQNVKESEIGGIELIKTETAHKTSSRITLSVTETILNFLKDIAKENPEFSTAGEVAVEITSRMIRRNRAFLVTEEKEQEPAGRT